MGVSIADISIADVVGIVVGLVGIGSAAAVVIRYMLSKERDRRIIWGTLGAVLVVIILAVLIARPSLSSTKGAAAQSSSSESNGSTATSGTIATPSPTATPTPSPTSSLPCVVDVGTWKGSADWKNLEGALLNDGSNWSYGGSAPTIVAPCQLGNLANYAVETQIQVLQVHYFACFGITIRGSTSNGWQGYSVDFGGCGEELNSAYLSGPGTDGAEQPFDPGTQVHTYRLEAKDNTIRFFIDGNLELSLTDNKYLTGSQVGLWDEGVQLQVTSFKVVAL